jgi:hypothetical protein
MKAATCNRGGWSVHMEDTNDAKWRKLLTEIMGCFLKHYMENAVEEIQG